MRQVIINEKELKKYSHEETLPGRLYALHLQQKETWELLRVNYEALGSVVKKQFEFDNGEVIVQHNPFRIKSTAADVSSKAIEKRACFLCEENLPEEQKALRYYKEYNILCNPYPIFTEHYTIVKTKHIAQSINNYLNDLLFLSRDLGNKLVVFYNGPECGASAPDHLHFQAGNKKTLPLYNELFVSDILKETVIAENKNAKVSSAQSISRSFLKISSSSSIEVLNTFSVILSNLLKVMPTENEPMLNLLCFYEKKEWHLVIILRRKHRPRVYFSEGKEKILVSPAAVDLSGVIILPREEDFNKINKNTIEEIYREVCLSKEIYEFIKVKISDFFA